MKKKGKTLDEASIRALRGARTVAYMKQMQAEISIPILSKNWLYHKRENLRKSLSTRERSVLERERSVLERERSVSDRERSVLERERSVLERERSVLERERSMSDRERNWKKSVKNSQQTKDHWNVPDTVDGLSKKQTIKEVGYQTKPKKLQAEIQACRESMYGLYHKWENQWESLSTRERSVSDRERSVLERERSVLERERSMSDRERLCRKLKRSVENSQKMKDHGNVLDIGDGVSRKRTIKEVLPQEKLKKVHAETVIGARSESMNGLFDFCKNQSDEDSQMSDSAASSPGSEPSASPSGSDLSKEHGFDFRGSPVGSPEGSQISGPSDLSFKSDRSKDLIINFSSQCWTSAGSASQTDRSKDVKTDFKKAETYSLQDGSTDQQKMEQIEKWCKAAVNAQIPPKLLSPEGAVLRLSSDSDDDLYG